MRLPRMVKLSVAALLMLVGLAIAVAASLVATYETAKVMAQTGFLIVVALLVFFLGIF